MTLYCVSQDQLVTYWWYVEADTEQQACLSDRNGVPDQAFSKLRRSETEATATPVGQPTEDGSRLVLPHWQVGYQIRAGVDDGQIAFDGTVTVRALDEEIAVELAEEWITDNDPRYDDRIQPQAVIVSTYQLDEPDSELGPMNNMPDGELRLEAAFAAALLEASARAGRGAATEADTELLTYTSSPRPEELSIPQSQAAALERWEHGNPSPQPT
jgi:hypothetical protein